MAHYRVWISFCALSIVGVTACNSAEPFAPEPGYKSLFNGTDLTGWRYGKEPMNGRTETPNKRFMVIDGAIVAAEGKGISDLTTIADFNGNFELKLEFRAAPKADSGVYVRGPQLQVRDFIRRNEQPGLKSVFKNDDWNELHITVGSAANLTIMRPIGKSDSLELMVKNGKASAKLNGQELSEKEISMSAGVTAICRLNGVQFDPNYKPGAKGGIGLQAETGKFEFRRIRVKEMQ